MWEIAGSFIGGICIMILKDSFMKGHQSATIKAHDIRLETLEREIRKLANLEQMIENHAERLISITRDHNHLDDLLDGMTKNLGENSSNLAVLKESVNGLRDLLQHIISKNLIIRK